MSNHVTYTLTDTTSIACHGTSFKTVAEAKNYALKLQRDWGLCKTYCIGEYTYYGHKTIYYSDKEYQK